MPLKPQYKPQDKPKRSEPQALSRLHKKAERTQYWGTPYYWTNVQPAGLNESVSKFRARPIPIGQVEIEDDDPVKKPIRRHRSKRRS